MALYRLTGRNRHHFDGMALEVGDLPVEQASESDTGSDTWVAVASGADALADSGTDTWTESDSGSQALSSATDSGTDTWVVVDSGADALTDTGSVTCTAAVSGADALADVGEIVAQVGTGFLLTDTFQRTVTGSVGEADTGQATTVDQGNASDYAVTPGALRITMPASQAPIFRYPVDLTDLDLLMEYQFDSLAAGALQRSGPTWWAKDALNYYRLTITQTTGGNTNLLVEQQVANVNTTVPMNWGSGLSSATKAIPTAQAANTKYWVRVKVSGSTFTVKAWADGVTEPSDTPGTSGTTIVGVGTDIGGAAQTHGAVGWRGQALAGNTNTPTYSILSVACKDTTVAAAVVEALADSGTVTCTIVVSGDDSQNQSGSDTWVAVVTGADALADAGSATLSVVASGADALADAGSVTAAVAASGADALADATAATCTIVASGADALADAGAVTATWADSGTEALTTVDSGSATLTVAASGTEALADTGTVSAVIDASGTTPLSNLSDSGTATATADATAAEALADTGADTLTAAVSGSDALADQATVTATTAASGADALADQATATAAVSDAASEAITDAAAVVATLTAAGVYGTGDSGAVVLVVLAGGGDGLGDSATVLVVATPSGVEAILFPVKGFAATADRAAARATAGDRRGTFAAGSDDRVLVTATGGDRAGGRGRSGDRGAAHAAGRDG